MGLEHPDALAMHRFDPLAPAVLADPYPFYAWLREHDPLHWGVSGDAEAAGCWMVTRYDDALALLKDERFGREIKQVEAGRGASTQDEAAVIMREWMVLRDPPVHTVLRGLVHRAFTPQVIERWTPRMAAIAAELVAPCRDLRAFDLMTALALPFPVRVVAEMLGVPPEDAPLFTPWTEALAALIEFEQTPEVVAQGNRAMSELADYLRGVIAERQRQPQDDLISALLLDNPEISEPVLLGACTQLLFGGNAPVAYLIANGVMALLRNPEQLAWLAAQPGTPTIAVDELMRFDSSVQMTFRYALRDVVWRDKFIGRGDLVAIVFGAANRDARQFDAPDCLNLHRTPNRHLSLGQGIHYCLGAALARTEGRVLLDTLLSLLLELQLAEERIPYARTVAVRGPERLLLARAA